MIGWLFPSGFPLPVPIIHNKTNKQGFVRVARPTCSFSDMLSSPQREISLLFIPEQLRICPCWLSLPQMRFKLLQNLDLFSGVTNHIEKDDIC